MKRRVMSVVTACVVCAALAPACRADRAAKPTPKTSASPTLAWLLPGASASNVAAMFRTGLVGLIGKQYKATTQNVELNQDHSQLTVTGLVVASDDGAVRIETLVVTALAGRGARVVASLMDGGHHRLLTATIHHTPEALSVVFPDDGDPGLRKLPGLGTAVGLPLSGELGAEIELDIPTESRTPPQDR